uniref:Uncharacterized protein n=1 Tax=Panagrolaimus sp. JU765 TaxID=591449 RepID=A0AC34QGI5_9BILA
MVFQKFLGFFYVVLVFAALIPLAVTKSIHTFEPAVYEDIIDITNPYYSGQAVPEKRAYMRLGKRAYMRLGKRSASQMDKRAILRLG